MLTTRREKKGKVNVKKKLGSVTCGSFLRKKQGKADAVEYI